MVRLWRGRLNGAPHASMGHRAAGGIPKDAKAEITGGEEDKQLTRMYAKAAHVFAWTVCHASE